MNSQIGLGIFGTFGEPYGFQQVFYYGAHFKGTLDLNDTAIEFYPGSELFSVRREIVDGVHSICICIYSYARELNTERFGTFIGSCMVLQDGFTEAEYIYKVLHSLHEDLITNEENIENGVIKVAQGADVIIREPAEFVAAQANLIPLNKTPFFSSFVDEDKKYLVIPSPHSFGNKETEVMEFLDEALKHYSDTGTLYFSFDRNVYEFVRNAGIIATLEWEDFKGRKTQMQRSTAVRTKKGIQKAMTIALPTEPYEAGNNAVQEVRNNEVAAAYGSDEKAVDEDTDSYTANDNYNNYSNTADDTEDEADSDPDRPFDLWEDPNTAWTDTEVRYRVKEYNRLFVYTHKLLDHINEPEQGKGRGRRRALAAALLLLLLAGGGAAVYFLGLIPGTEQPVRTAAVESPRSIRQGIPASGDSMATGVATDTDGSVANVSPEERYTMPRGGVSDEEIARALADAPATPPSVITGANAVNNAPAQQRVAGAVTDNAPATSALAGAPAAQQGNKPVIAAQGTPADAKSIAANTTNSTAARPGAPATPAMGGDAGDDPSRSMPQISMPSMPRSNIPAAASYVSRIGKEPLPGANTNTGVAAGTDASGRSTPSNISRPATAETIRPGAANAGTPPAGAGITTKAGITTQMPAAVAASPASKTVAGVAVQPNNAIVPGNNSTNILTPGKVVPATTAPAPVTGLAKAQIGATAPATASPFPVGRMNQPTGPATAAVPVAARAVSTVAPTPAALTNGARTGSMTPTQPAPLAASSSPTGARSVGMPTVAAAGPAGGQRSATSTSTLAISGSVPSGVSSGEINRANAVVMPSLGMGGQDPMKMKTLYPRPNGQLTQRDIPILKQNGIKNKTLTELTRIIMESAPEDVGQYYKGQELQYAAALLNSNRQAFQRSGNDYICTADYLILHIPAIIKPKRPVTSPK
ncbi:hypothetical protein GCM10023093_12680 [Nemorincola caseinilytica]|uniref:Uncharacterized protein n=1 Tax=Nemorincola caseinilytica TaxID=2054315 RepID=A0ABP8N9N2_9BACT